MVDPADGMSIRCPSSPTTERDTPSPTTAAISGTVAATALRKPNQRMARAASSPMISLCRVEPLSAAAARLPPGVTSIPAASAGRAASTIRRVTSGVMSRSVTSSSTERKAVCPSALIAARPAPS